MPILKSRIVQYYPTAVESQVLKTSQVPEIAEDDILHERMFGVAIQYHFLPVEPNQSPSKECVYQYLLERYSQLKTLTKERSTPTKRRQPVAQRNFI